VSWSLETRDSIAFVDYSNPPENRLPFAALRDLDELLEPVGADVSIKLVVFRSRLDGVFSAGADLLDIKAMSTGGLPSAPFDWWRRALQRVEESPLPTIAFVDGLAASGGAELALACTMRVGTPRAEFVFREIARGAMPGAGATQRLPRIVGLARAAEIIMSARRVSAEEALKLGVLQAVLPVDGSAGQLAEWLNTFIAMPRSGLIATKRAIVDGSRLPLLEGLRLEQRLFRDLLAQNSSAAPGGKAAGSGDR
jgi:enoyl-CoA hydratase/carnithine racemase